MTWLLGILGVGGVGIAATFLLGGGPVLLLYGAKALGFLKGLSPKAWLYIAIAAAVIGCFFLHQHLMHRHDAALVKSTITAEDQRIAAQALAAKKKIDSRLAAVVAPIRSRNDETNRIIIGSARAIGLLGPGKAACGRSPGLPGPASGPVAPGGNGDAAGPYMPPEDRAAVPWVWLTDRAEEHDLDRAEVLSWRLWYQKVLAAWPKSEPAKRPDPG